MRCRIFGRKVWTILTVDRREHWIAPPRTRPSLAEASNGDRHPVRGLVARHACAPVSALWLEEGVALGSHGAGCVEEAHASKFVGTFEIGWHDYVAARLDPAQPVFLCIARRSGPRAARDDKGDNGQRDEPARSGCPARGRALGNLRSKGFRRHGQIAGSSSSVAESTPSSGKSVKIGSPTSLIERVASRSSSSMIRSSSRARAAPGQ